MKFLGEEKEWLVQFCNEKIKELNVDYFIFGHRHLPINYMLKNGTSRYINIGEWMHACSYGVFDGNEMKIQFFENDEGEVFYNDK